MGGSVVLVLGRAGNGGLKRCAEWARKVAKRQREEFDAHWEVATKNEILFGGVAGGVIGANLEASKETDTSKKP